MSKAAEQPDAADEVGAAARSAGAALAADPGVRRTCDVQRGDMGARQIGRYCILSCAVAALAACASAPQSEPAIRSSSSSAAITDEMVGRRFPPMVLKEVASSPEYGRSQKAPIPVGGGFGAGAQNVYRFLNGLMGPMGEAAHYNRVGTCCAFKTANSPFDGEGVLEVYEITYTGSTSPIRLYFNWYDTGSLLVPVGLTARHD